MPRLKIGEDNLIFIPLEIKQVVFDAATENWRR